MLDTTTNAGATPAAGGATPPQSEPAKPATGTSTAATTEPAKGDEDALGEPGKRALQIEREAVKTAKAETALIQKELDALKTAGQSEAEKALTQAKKDGATEERSKLSNAIRRSEVRGALVAAGIQPSVLDLAVKADEFGALKVDEDGAVEGLEPAVKTFKESHKDLFGTALAGGSSDGGARGGARLTRDQVAEWSKDPVQYEKHRDEIMGWLAGGGR